MEYIDGTTLAETLRERGPLELQEAREIASQFLSRSRGDPPGRVWCTGTSSRRT